MKSQVDGRSTWQCWVTYGLFLSEVRGDDELRMFVSMLVGWFVGDYWWYGRCKCVNARTLLSPLTTTVIPVVFQGSFLPNFRELFFFFIDNQYQVSRVLYCSFKSVSRVKSLSRPFFFLSLRVIRNVRTSNTSRQHGNKHTNTATLPTAKSKKLTRQKRYSTPILLSTMSIVQSTGNWYYSKAVLSSLSS